MNIKKIIIVIIWSVFAFTVQAQYTNNPSATVHADQRIDKLVDLHIAYNQEFPIMDGYRIQLNMSSGNAALDNLNEIKAEFEEKYPEIKSYIIFREPYYRLRIGDLD